MVLYINLDNCRKEYPEIEFKLDVRGILHVSCPKKYNHLDVIPRLLTMLELDNEGLEFPSAEGIRKSAERWHTKIHIDVEMEYFLKEDAESVPVNGKITKTFVVFRFAGLVTGDIYKVDSDEEAHQMALEDEDCIGYDLFRREYTNVDGKIIQGESKTYKKVIFGKPYTLREIVAMNEGYTSIYLSAIMVVFGQDKAVKTRDGKFVVWDKDVEYISE